jgi:hypothetical protein
MGVRIVRRVETEAAFAAAEKRFAKDEPKRRSSLPANSA